MEFYFVWARKQGRPVVMPKEGERPGGLVIFHNKAQAEQFVRWTSVAYPIRQFPEAELEGWLKSWRHLGDTLCTPRMEGDKLTGMEFRNIEQLLAMITETPYRIEMSKAITQQFGAEDLKRRANVILDVLKQDGLISRLPVLPTLLSFPMDDADSLRAAVGQDLTNKRVLIRFYFEGEGGFASTAPPLLTDGNHRFKFGLN